MKNTKNSVWIQPYNKVYYSQVNNDFSLLGGMQVQTVMPISDLKKASLGTETLFFARME